MKKIKAVGLLSGGLDSTLAVKLMLDQGIKVYALNFTSPFCLCNTKNGCFSARVAKKFKLPLKVINKGTEYLKLIRNPKYGYGSGMNPCIDCRIFILKKAKQYAKQIRAGFIFTGEVLGQRPMSQHEKALKIIEKETGLKNKILRPLSAKLLPVTDAEKKGLVNRNKLLAIRGRSRKPQIKLAEELKVTDYPCPAGGCLLTYKEFANKVRDIFKHNKRVTMNDISLLKIGRHFRFNDNKIIVGRNEQDNKALVALKKKTDYYFEVPVCGSPVTILQGRETEEAVKIAAKLTARYSDATGKEITVKYGRERAGKSIMVQQASDKEVRELRI